jgi:hypothetical protein
LLLPVSGGVAELSGPGRAAVGGIDLVGGPPDLDVADEGVGQRMIKICRPRGNLTGGLGAHLIGQVGDE